VNDKPRIRVLCVDDNPDLALLLHRHIGLQHDMASAGTLQDLDGIVEEIRERRPDVVVLDLMVLGRDSTDMLGELQRHFPTVRAVVYSGFEDEALIARAQAQGAWGYVVKREDVGTLLDAVRRVAAGERAFPRC